MEHLIAVAAVLAIATAVTGLLLPLTTRRNETTRAEREESLSSEAAIRN